MEERILVYGIRSFTSGIKLLKRDEDFMGKIDVLIDEEINKQYRSEGFWGDATLLDYWLMSVKAYPDKTCVLDGHGGRLTFRELNHLSDKIAACLVNDAGVEPGDVVSVQLPNWIEFTMIYIAVLKAGAVINPLIPKFMGSEMAYRMKKCHSKVLFIANHFAKTDYVKVVSQIMNKLPDLKKVVLVNKENVEMEDVPDKFVWLDSILEHMMPIEKYIPAKANDVAVVLFTSGTEGEAKGVMLTHNNIAANMKGYISMTQLNSNDSMLMPVPIAHASGFMYGVTVPFMVGYKSVLLDKFNAEDCMKTIEAEKCTAIEGPTVIAVDLLHQIDCAPEKYDISSLRYFYCGGSPVPSTIVEKGLEMGIHILGVYGSTESAPHCVVAPYHSVEKVLTTDGKPVPGVRIKVVDQQENELGPYEEGEEYSKGPNVFVGYIGEPEMTAAAFDDGWFKSGDLCHWDNDGYIRITGRKKDIIIRGGENISSAEIEGVLLLHPNIKEAAVVAYPDERLGERACAYLVLHHSEQTLELKDIQEHMQSHHVAKYKWPEKIELTDALPRNACGKILKYILKEDIRKKLNIQDIRAKEQPPVV